MIVYRCKFCNTTYISAHVLICEECGGNEFLKENLNMAPPESNLPPKPETISSWSRPNDPIGEVNVQMMSVSPCQREQMEAAREDFNFSHEDSIVNECHVNEDPEVFNFPNQHISLEQGKLSEHLSKYHIALNTLSPEVENSFDQTQISHLTATDAAASNFSSRHIPLEPEDFSKHTALNTLLTEMQNIWDQSQTSHLTATEFHRNEDAEASNFSCQHLAFDLEEVLNNFRKNHTEENMSLPRFHETFCQTQASRVQDSDRETCSNSNYVADSTSSSLENPQNLLNFHGLQSNSDSEKHLSNKMILGEQIITESKQMNNQENQLNISVSCASTGVVSKFIPENFIFGHNAIDTQNNDDYFAVLFNSIGNSSTENFSLQHGAHSSSTQTPMVHQTRGVENFSVLRALLMESSAPPTSMSGFECEICKRKFTTEFLFTIHVQAHKKRLPFKCNQCSKAFQWGCSLRQHRTVHMQEKTFKCSYCDFASKWKHAVNKHIGHRHKSHVSSQCATSNGERKCGKCLKRFIKESAFNAHVTSNCDPKPFKCDQCSLKFPFECKLKKHYRVHTGEKSWYQS